MSEYSSLKTTINANVKTNGNQEITGAVLNSVLNAMVSSLGAGYQYMGMATPTNPGSAQTPDYKCFYLAITPGTYTYLGGLEVSEGEVALLKWDTSWKKEFSRIASRYDLVKLARQNLAVVPLYWESGTIDPTGAFIPSPTEVRSQFIDVNWMIGCSIHRNGSRLWINEYAGDTYYGYYEITSDVSDFAPQNSDTTRIVVISQNAYSYENIVIENNSIFALKTDVKDPGLPVIPFSFYNMPDGYTAINIDTINGKVTWESAYFILYSKPISDEHTIAAGETNFIGGVNPAYSYYVFYNKTDKTFEAVQYDALDTYLAGGKDVYLIAVGGLDHPQSTLITGGTIKVDDVAYLPNSKKPLGGKTFSIIGDSISTYSGYLVSSKQGYVGASYAAWYPRGDVNNVNNTWWKKIEKMSGMKLLNNCAWSGSQATGDSLATNTAYCGCSDKRIADVAFGGVSPDIIIVYIGINDFGQNSTGVKPLGDWTGDTEIPVEGQQTYYSDSMALLLSKLQKTYKNSKIFCCTLLETGQAGYDYVDASKFPVININGDTLHKWNTRIKTICAALGVPLVDLHTCGINYENLDDYTVDRLHPNTAGHELMARFIYNSLLKEY